MNVGIPCKKIKRCRHDVLIANILLFIHTHSKLDANMSLVLLAKQRGWAPFHLHPVFRTIVVEPVGHYVRRKRLEDAATCLVLSGARLDDIAERIGYEFASVFARVFKKIFDVAPDAFISGSNGRLPTQGQGGCQENSRNMARAAIEQE